MDLTSMVVYRYESPIGTFTIRPNEPEAGRWGLYCGDACYRTYDSAQAAADDVYRQSTGVHAWDSAPSITEPTALFEWNRVPRRVVEGG